ncbi:MAG: BON domain-containing protein [Rudaea sp.]
MADTDYPYDDPYYGYYDPYYGFYGEPRYGERGRTGYDPRNENWSPGPYTGQGPRNYLRSDARIGDDLNDRLWLDGQLDARDIEVTVSNGVVTLSGYVESRGAKRRAGDIAWGVPGVWDVNNQLRVNRSIGMRAQMREGMHVLGAKGKEIGTIVQVEDIDFVVRRDGNPDLFIPYTAVEHVEGGRVTLNRTVEDLAGENWPIRAQPPRP